MTVSRPRPPLTAKSFVASIPTSWYVVVSRFSGSFMADVHHESKAALLNAALAVFRVKGYAATRVEDICEAADLTKGSFFHHFKSKEDLALAAAEHWITVTSPTFVSAAYQTLPDPLDRLLAYIDFRKALLTGALPEFTCFAGTMIQEVYETHPAVRDACEKSISGHAATLEADIDEAMRLYCVDPSFSAESLALYTQAVMQGAFILAKAKQGPAVAVDCVDHLRRYIEMLFAPRQPRGCQ
jgi:TetR/AcrR family transcriptional regulator, transcriptional repressor for nem operon